MASSRNRFSKRPNQREETETRNLRYSNPSQTTKQVYPRAKDSMFRVQSNGSFKRFTLMNLQNIYRFVEWKLLLQNIFSTNFTMNDEIYVVAPSYMDKLTKVLAHFQSRVIHNTLLLIYATDLLSEMGTSLSGQEKSTFCTKVTVRLLSQAVSALYVTQYTPMYLQHLATRVQKMLSNLKLTLKERMEALPWLDGVSRKAAVSKISTIQGHFLTWPHLWNMTFISALLRKWILDPTIFFENVIRQYKQLRNVSANFHKELSSIKKWPYPFFVNAFYEVTMNSIVIPLAVLTQPYFRQDMPEYLRYGSLGMVLSHELLHALDTAEVVYDATGSKISWLTKKTTLKLEARLECISKQYEDAFHKQVLFRGSKVPVQFDWNITRNENMADISGLQIAYETWRIHHDNEKELPDLSFTSKQLFFITAAQVFCSRITPEDYIIQVEKDFHTPAPERVNGIMMNSPEFAEAFACPVGSKMNPPRKCSAY